MKIPQVPAPRQVHTTRKVRSCNRFPDRRHLFRQHPHTLQAPQAP